jgi:hypothetical protein
MLTYILSRLYIYIILHARYNIIQLGTYLLFQYLIHIILNWGKVRHRFYTIIIQIQKSIRISSKITII